MKKSCLSPFSFSRRERVPSLSRMAINKSIQIIVLFVLIFSFAGCATKPYYIPPSGIKKMPGIYHRVKRGETLWRIAKTYDIDLDKIVQVNRIPNAARINSGQLIFIPNAKEKQKVVTYEELKEGDATFIWPLKGKVISYYGAKKGNVKNKGIDIRTREGAKVVASRSGRVSFCGEKVKGYGKTIIIQHGDDYSTVYAHNSQILVKAGDWVRQGEAIARAGSTGRTSTPILHLEIRKKHQPQNPFHYLP